MLLVRFIRSLAILIAFIAFSFPVQAAANRTFVSTGGSDSNTSLNCGATTPCRTFGAALSATNSGGEIVVLTSGGYGPATIRQAVTITAVGHVNERAVHFPVGMLIGYHRQIRGALAGDSNLLYDIPMLLGLYKSGQLKLDELITRKYSLDQVNQAYQDLNDGKNIRGVIIHEH